MKDNYFYYNYDKKVHFDVSNFSDIDTVRDISNYTCFEQKSKKFDEKFTENIFLNEGKINTKYQLKKELDNIGEYHCLVPKNKKITIISDNESEVFYTPSSSIIVSLIGIDIKNAKVKLSKVLKKYEAFFFRKMAPHLLGNCFVIKIKSQNKLDTLDLCVDLKEGFPDIIEYAIPDLFTKFTLNAFKPVDPHYPLQWYLKGGGNPNLKGCNLEEAWEICNTKGISPGQNVKVAVLDTGNFNHEDLPQSKIFFSTSVIDDSLSPITNNGMVSESHGTAISTIINANYNNNVGMAGIAPFGSLVSIKSLPISNFQFGAISTALDLAKSKGCKVVNISFGTTEDIGNQHLDQVLANYSNEALICCSSGNFYPNRFDNYQNPQIMYPANHMSVLTVGSCDNLGKHINGGGFGFKSGYIPVDTAKTIDLVAPGYKIICGKRDNQYYKEPNEIFSGTSASTAVVAGIATLLLSLETNMSISDLKNIILTSCDFTPGQLIEKIGNGRLNAGLAASKLV
jgi:Subtilase family